MKRKSVYHIITLLAIFTFGSCSIDVDLNAPAKDIWSVYSILDPQKDVQYVRVSRGFLPEENALNYAKQNDLSVKGLRVVLSGNGQTYEATQIDEVPKNPEEGIFFPNTTLYEFRTEGNSALKPGERYDLTITKPDEPDFSLNSYTEVPEDMVFQNISPVPGGPGGLQRCLRRANLEFDYKVEFTRGTAVAYEMRAFLRYQENGIEKNIVYGPTNMFDENFRCTTAGGGSSAICYQFREKEILTYFYNIMKPDPTFVYTYGITSSSRCKEEIENLPDDVRIEVTGMDQFLANYRSANDPRFVDLNSVRPEYTNISGPENAGVLGIFGSVNTSSGKVRLSPCAEYILSLNNAPRPDEPCEL